MDPTDRVVWVTGAARRLGRAVALDLARRGAHVAVHCHTSRNDAEHTAEAVRALGRRALVVEADLGDPAAIAQAADAVDDAFGRIDILVNNAANFLRTPLDDLTEAAWDRTLDVNLKGAAWCALEAARRMRRDGRGGKIVNLTDAAASRPGRHYLPYLVSKGGLETLTRALAMEWAPEIQVNAVAPGLIALDDDATQPERERPIERPSKSMIERIPARRAGTADDVTTAVAFLIERGDYITGQTLRIDGGRSLVATRYQVV